MTTTAGTRDLVTLTWSELRDADAVGLERWAVVRLREHTTVEGRLGPSWWQERDRHMFGAEGELAFCKYMDCYWPGSHGDGYQGSPDAGRRTEVRTCHAPDGLLWVHRRRWSSDAVYVLVDASRRPVFRVVGWIPAREVVRDEWHVPASPTQGEAWSVPQRFLRPMSELSRGDL